MAALPAFMLAMLAAVAPGQNGEAAKAAFEAQHGKAFAAAMVSRASDDNAALAKTLVQAMEDRALAPAALELLLEKVIELVGDEKDQRELIEAAFKQATEALARLRAETDRVDDLRVMHRLHRAECVEFTGRETALRAAAHSRPATANSARTPGRARPARMRRKPSETSTRLFRSSGTRSATVPSATRSRQPASIGRVAPSGVSPRRSSSRASAAIR